MTQPGREGPLTVASLVDEALDTARGYTRNQDIVTSLAAPMTDTDLTLSVTDATSISKGILEIEDELVQVKTVDQSAGTVTLEPWGRGLSGSAAVAHLADVRVTMAPLYPRQRVRQALYGVLREIFPDVFAVKTALLDGNPSRPSWIMAADCWKILSVHSRNIYDPNLWTPVKRWRTSTTETQTELQALGGLVPGTQTVRVMYVRTPATELDQTTDLSTWGYDYQLRDLIVLGATIRLLQYAEANRVQVQTQEAHGRSEVTPAGSVSALVRMLYQMYQKRIDDERRQLQARYPMQPHFVR